MKYRFYILLLAVLVGCDIFTTRDPETPDQSRSSYVDAFERETVIQNLINAFADKNADDYLKSFSKLEFTNRPFQFVPSSTALARYLTIWNGWDISSEFQSFNNMINLVPDELPVVLDLSKEPNSFSILGDSLRYTSEYFISVPQGSGDPLIFEGNVEFSMILDSRSIWVIYFWKDNAIGDKPSWSDLKGSLY
ncbi:MAG: hypothetical protein JSW63_08010 [Ignavibacterium sp.]|nr:MAG: hypothetical protein JSW63_08010 [Ignavibacterium sp.]